MESVGICEGDFGETGSCFLFVEGVQIAVFAGVDEVCGAGVGEGEGGELLVSAFGPWAFVETVFSRTKTWQDAEVEGEVALIPSVTPIVNHDFEVSAVVGFIDVAFALVPSCASDGVGDDGVEHGVELRGYGHPVKSAFGGEGGWFWCGGGERRKRGFRACEPFACERNGFEFGVEGNDGELSGGDTGVSGVGV